MVKNENGTHVVVTNPFTGERRTIVSVNRDLGAMMHPHRSEEWFLFGDRPGEALDRIKPDFVGADTRVHRPAHCLQWLLCGLPRWSSCRQPKD
jgi:hypothetical protein